MGYGRATTLTAIGDTVNVASRLETLTKEFEVELVVSSRLAEAAGIDLGAFEERRIEIRGRRRPLRVRLVGDVGALPLEAVPEGVASAPARAWLASLGRAIGALGDRDRHACWTSRFADLTSYRYLVSSYRMGTIQRCPSPIGRVGSRCLPLCSARRPCRRRRRRSRSISSWCSPSTSRAASTRSRRCCSAKAIWPRCATRR